MQVKCPKCGYAGNIADKLVPDEGRNVSCPKCKTGIFVKREIPAEVPIIEPSANTIPESPTIERDHGHTEVKREVTSAKKEGNPYKDPKYFFTQLAAILSGGMCIATGIWLSQVRQAEGEGNVLFTICNGIGYYFIAKGIFIGFSLWNLAKIRESQNK